MAQLRKVFWVKDGVPRIGRSLHGARIGIVGLGAIGRALAWRCELPGMQVSWWGPRPKADASWPRAEFLEALARDTDLLAICTSADETTVGMISSAAIRPASHTSELQSLQRISSAVFCLKKTTSYQ